MTISKLSTLISAPWLRQQISSAYKLSSNLRVLDVSWNMMSNEPAGYDFYAEEHIPSSLHFDLKEISPAKEGTPHAFSIPDPKLFKDYVEDLGVSNHTHVVLYDRTAYLPSFRSWFLFRLLGHDRVSVLNGCLKGWKAHGYPVIKEEPNVERGVFDTEFRRHLLKDFDAMTSIVKTGKEQLVDSRGAASFYGTAEDHEGGHMPGAVNIPFTSMINKDETFKSVEELKALFAEANVDLNQPMVATCMIGVSACTLAAAAFQCGKEDVPVYNGSFIEWSKIAHPSQIVKLKKEE